MPHHTYTSRTKSGLHVGEVSVGVGDYLGGVGGEEGLKMKYLNHFGSFTRRRVCRAGLFFVLLLLILIQLYYSKIQYVSVSMLHSVIQEYPYNNILLSIGHVCSRCCVASEPGLAFPARLLARCSLCFTVEPPLLTMWWNTVQ